LERAIYGHEKNAESLAMINKVKSYAAIVFLIFYIGADIAHAGFCSDDVARFCNDISVGNRQVSLCLKENFNYISPKCSKFAGQIKIEKKVLRQICYKDVRAFCNNTIPGQNRVYNCLIQNSKVISADCKSKLEEVLNLINQK
jgi:Cysteine rich repeat